MTQALPQPYFALPSEHILPKDKKVAYINARLIDPETGLDCKGSLLTQGSVIADFGPDLFSDKVPEGIEVVDCKGHVLCPGLLDIQVHFREPGQEYKETIQTGSKSAAVGGVTTVVCMANTIPRIDQVPVLDFLNKKAKESSYVNIFAYASTPTPRGEPHEDFRPLCRRVVRGPVR
jgi:dihydroorotase